jgi:hypothetical protein
MEQKSTGEIFASRLLTKAMTFVGAARRAVNIVSKDSFPPCRL